jgi:8-amino-7-oxononanoate synthase
VTTLEQRITAILNESQQSNQMRSLETVQTPQGRVVRIGSSEFLNFCSNDYLGLSAHPQLSAAAAAAAKHYGVGSGASALLSGRSTLHEELENKLAKFMQRDRALLFSSGYLANIGAIGTLVRRDDHLFCDQLNHASLIDAVALTKAPYTRFAHTNVNSLGLALGENTGSARWIITDTLFSMDGDLAPLADYAELSARHDATIIGDDAHGFGVLAEGRGAAAAAGLSQDELPVQIVTFGKALGTAGAAVVGSNRLIQSIIQRGRTFIYDTAPPPMIAGATIAALEIVETNQQLHKKLADNIAQFRQLGAQLPLLESDSPIQPIMIGQDSTALAIATELQNAGIYIRAIRPPTVPVGTARLRICISAAHLGEDLEALVEALKSAFARHSQ